jgi:predicted polyphosphate/ATP-dependent NAD kinase
MQVKRLGLIINPIAGIGGRVGLKGSDGQEIVDKAMRLGAVLESPRKAIIALKELRSIKERFELITYPHEMGEDEAKACGMIPKVIGSIKRGSTTAKNTHQAAKDMLNLKVDLLLFAGGDGTARDVCAAIKGEIPALGIPSGVKIHSSVYATNPTNAGIIARQYLSENASSLRLCEGEVMDINEEAFREGRLEAKLYGYLKVPYVGEMIQDAKGATIPGQESAMEALIRDVLGIIEDDVLYIIGPGSTTRFLMDKLGLKSTLLGIDAIYNRELVGSDLSEVELLELVRDKKTKIIVTVIGRQGYIFGRGNQQISPDVIRLVGKENIIVLATKEKLLGLGGKPLLVDTGDQRIDMMIQGYIQVITGYGERVVLRIAA